MAQLLVASLPSAAALTLRSSFVPSLAKKVSLKPVVQKASSSRVTGARADSNTEKAIGIVSLVSVPVVFVSEYYLKTTGCGLPPGPGGSIGAIEGISYLVVAGLVGWSIITKIQTGKGLPAGPNGLLGAAEGLAYLAVLAGIIVLALQYSEYGYIPSALPDAKCFG
eukprot:jgi/Mesvir1/24206/Mv10921-RA.1